jgi:hypothetical protein
MQRVPFVGRDDLLGRFDLALAEAAAGAGSLLLIYGEAGIGKTRLCEQIRQGTGIAAALPCSGGPFRTNRSSPSGRSLTRCGWPAVRSRRCGKRRPRAPTSWARLLPSSPAWRRTGRAGRLTARWFSRRLLDAVEEAAPGDRAALWVLDDAHWADDATWHFVRYAARRIAVATVKTA